MNKGFTPLEKVHPVRDLPLIGFTLIEILIYVAIIGMVVAGFVAFSMSISDSRNKTYVVQEVQANARTALDIMAQKIRLADDVVSPSEAGSGSSLELDMPGSDPNLTFGVASDVLQIAETGGDTTAITSDEVNVSSLTFTNLAVLGERDNIRIQMTVEYANTGDDKEYTYSKSFQTAVSLRQ